MTAGRPIGSETRQNIVELLQFMKKGYGYEIHKVYLELFPKASQRLIYYHLKKGVLTGEFMGSGIEKEEGEYSWGENAEKTYYSLGRNAKPRILESVREFIVKRRKKGTQAKAKTQP